jgi:hypothetical protein
MNAESCWTTAGLARELAFIRTILELQIVVAQAIGRMPSPSEIQTAYHASQNGHNDPARAGDVH